MMNDNSCMEPHTFDLVGRHKLLISRVIINQVLKIIGLFKAGVTLNQPQSIKPLPNSHFSRLSFAPILTDKLHGG